MSRAMQERNKHINELAKIYRDYYDSLFLGRRVEHLYEIPEAVADILLKQAKMNNERIVNERSVAALYGIKVDEDCFDNNELSGVLDLTGDVATITINSKHNQERQRFTIAHEIGHYLLHYRSTDKGFLDTTLYTFQDKITNKIEAEASRFAAALLMSSDVIQDELTQVSDLYDLANRFKVFPAAMQIRLDILKARLR
jgi:Zn-dependent peptidase ImmA (M78 family)